jgi:FixJ family two-component response regulator
MDAARPAAATVYVVDDEEPVGDSIAMLLRSVGLSTRVYQDARAFLEECPPGAPGCVLLDVRMPRMSGLEVQEELNRRSIALPVIFITGHGDVPMAVAAMRAGALDFIQKPFNDNELIRRVQNALAEDRRQRDLLQRRDEIAQRWSGLTPREREIAQRIGEGEANKVIAGGLAISERTVELHRAHVMQKMGARGVAQLVRMILAMKEGPA